MKKILTLAFASVLACAPAANVIFQFQTPFGQAAAPAVSVTPASVPLQESNTIVLSGMQTFRWPTNGTVVDAYGNTNWYGWTNNASYQPQLKLPLSAGLYYVQVSSYPRPWAMVVENSTNTFYASDLSSNILILAPQPVTIINTNPLDTNTVSDLALLQAQAYAGTGNVATATLATTVTGTQSNTLANLDALATTNNQPEVSHDYISPVGGAVAINVTDRQLSDNTTTTRVDWQNGLLYLGSGGGWQASLDWFNKTFPNGWNGAGLTNLTATNLVGIVSTNNLPMSQLGGSVAGAVTTSNVNTSLGFQAYSPTFSAGNMDTLPKPGWIWGNVQKPTVRIYMGYGGLQHCSESNVLYNLNYLKTNNMLTNILNNYKVLFQVDVGWEVRRNFDFGFVRTNLGTLMWNTNRFPHGIPWLCSALASNNCELQLDLYYRDVKIPDGASGWACNLPASIVLPYTNTPGDSTIYYDSGAASPYCEIITPQTVRQDMTELQWWGVSSIVVNDITVGDALYFSKECNLINDGLAGFRYPLNFNGSPTVGYFEANTANISTNSWSFPVDYATNFTISTRPGYFKGTKSLSFFPFLRGPDYDYRSMANYVFPFINGEMYENAASPLSQNYTNWLNDHTSITDILHGGMELGGLYQYFHNFNVLKLASFGYKDDGLGSSIESKFPLFYSQTTNQLISKLLEDPLHSKPKLVKDYVSCKLWKRDLSNGDVLVAFDNSGPGNTTQAYPTNMTWDWFGLSTNIPYVVYGLCPSFINTAGQSDASGAFVFVDTNGVYTATNIHVNNNGCGLFRIHNPYNPVSVK